MKWLEVIKLRSTANVSDLVDEYLLPMVEALNESAVELKIYRQAGLDTDVSVHLHWSSDLPELKGSALGLHLAQALKEFGLVDHSVWIEENREQMRTKDRSGI